MRPTLRQSNLLMDNSITLYGASGHCKVIIDILLRSGLNNLNVLDDNPAVTEILGFPVKPASGIDTSANRKSIISIGNNRVRERISREVKADYISVVHPSATVSPLSKIGNGTVVMANVSINPDSRIGDHCIINTGSVIEHDNMIGDFVHISPAVSLAGNVSIGDGTHVGIGAIVIQGIKIGKWATIGAGAVIIRDVPDYAVVVGNPGKIIKYNSHE